MRERFLVRGLEIGEYSQWKTLWDGYNAFYGREGATALPDEITRTTWARFFDAYEPMHAMVAATPDTIVGFAHFLLHRSTIQIAPTIYLQDLFTVESARGSGVGRALITAVYQYATAAGLPHVYWQTHETNSVAMRLYDSVAEKFGFVVYDKLL